MNDEIQAMKEMKEELDKFVDHLYSEWYRFDMKLREKISAKERDRQLDEQYKKEQEIRDSKELNTSEKLKEAI